MPGFKPMSSFRHLIFALTVLSLMTGCAVPRHDPTPTILSGTVLDPAEIRGLLQQDLSLDGVIRITGDLYVPVGRTLFVAPGTRILVLGNDSTKIDPEYLSKGTEILVTGSIHVAGSERQPVTLSLDEGTPAGENWAGIELIGAEAASFSHVDIIGAETGILSIDSSPRLEQVNILASGSGIMLQGGGELVFQSGRISGGDAGLLCFDSSRLLLVNLTISDNLEEGLYLAPGCSVQPQNLQILRNDLGVVAKNPYRQSLLPALRDNRVDFKSLPETYDQ
jgi:hypothetical protein